LKHADWDGRLKIPLIFSKLKVGDRILFPHIKWEGLIKRRRERRTFIFMSGITVHILIR
jgi:hypothetical protein